MIKIDHWQAALVKRAQAMLGTPFEYGHTDCPNVCFELCHAMTGEDVGAPHRGQYSTRREAYDYIARIGFNLEGYLRSLGMIEVQPGYQQLGDFILTRTAEGWVRGHVCLGERCISADQQAGVSLYDTQQILTLPDHTSVVLRIA